MKGQALTLKPREDLEDGQFLTGYNTKVMIGDRELYGVASVDIAYRPDDVVKATVELFSVEEEIIGGVPVIKMAHPITGEFLEVAKITFVNGETYEPLA